MDYADIFIRGLLILMILAGAVAFVGGALFIIQATKADPYEL